jgi:hypothetical protein
MPDTDQTTWLTPAQLGARLGMKPTALRAWRTKRVGPQPTYFSERTVRYSLAEVERWEAAQYRLVVREQVAESRARQGLPPTVTDEATLDRVAALVATSETEGGEA